MNLPFKRNYLQHALAVSDWIARHGARGGIDSRTQVMEITLRERVVRFYPQFVVEIGDGTMGFVPALQPNVSGFVSWLPYRGKAWPAAQDKLEFKALAQATGMRTPKWTQDAQQARGAVLVKARRSTLGRGQRGPFEVGLGRAEALQLSEGEYAEQFIVGRMVKAWFWNDELAVAEVVEMPTVRGTGSSTVQALIAQACGHAAAVPRNLEPLLAIQGLTIDTVLPEGSTALADYRYMSVMNPALHEDRNVRAQIKGSAIEAALLAAGRSVLATIPLADRANTAYSLDGIVDRDGELWLLEANCNPLLHPAFYEVMLDSLFGCAPGVEA